MKKTIFMLLSVFSAYASAQIALGKSDISKLSDNVTPNPDISLEFGAGNKGIVLPWTNGATNSAPFITGYAGTETIVDGTILYDTTDKKVKYKKSGTWFDLSIDTNGVTNTILQDSKTDLANAKVALGKDGATDSTPGILVLTDKDKAMILPKVAEPHLNIKNPAAGMMAYDTTSRQLAVYNGTNWTFWKP